MNQSFLTGVLSSVLLLGASLPMAAQAEDFSAQTLKKFAQAEPQVDAVRIQYLKDVFKVHDAKQAAAMTKKAELQMAKLVEKNGLQVAQYNEVSAAAAEDGSLRERIAQVQ